MKHRNDMGNIDVAGYANAIGKLKTHNERIDYMSDLTLGFQQLCYLLSMQMSLPETIANLPSREERKRLGKSCPRTL